MLFLRIIFIVSIVWLSFFGPYSAFLNSNPIKDKNFIDVFEGSSMYAVLDNLKLSSLINKLFFRIYLDTNSIKSFQAGEYDIKNKNFKEIIDLLVKGKTYTHSLTIIEGMNVYDIEKELIQQTLEEFSGNKTKAAESLGISIRTLRNKINEYNETTKE